MKGSVGENRLAEKQTPSKTDASGESSKELEKRTEEMEKRNKAIQESNRVLNRNMFRSN